MLQIPFHPCSCIRRSQNHRLASLLRHWCAMTPLKGKSIWVFSPAVTLKRPSIPHLGHSRLAFHLEFWEPSIERQKEKRKNINTVHLICCSLSAEIKGTILPVGLKVDFSVFFLFFCTGSSRKHSASHWCLQNIAQESVDSSDEEFFDARG